MIHHDSQNPSGPATALPVVLVSFSDASAVTYFAEAIQALAQTCEIHVTGPQEVITNAKSLQGLTLDSEEKDWRDSIAFASRVISGALETRPFVLRLPLQADTLENETAARLAIQSLAAPEAFEEITKAFAKTPDLALIGPDVLYKPMFPMVRDNIGTISEIERVANLALLTKDRGTFPAQAFAISGQALGRMRPTLERYEQLLSDERSVIPYAQPGSIGAAMDMVWCGLALAAGGQVGLLRWRLDDDEIILRFCDGPDFVREIGRDEDFVTTLRRQSRARPDFDLLKREADFEPAKYVFKNRRHIPKTFSALEHYVLYGDVAHLYCHDQLNIAEYRMILGSKIAHFDNTLCHWIVRERPETEVKTGTWLGFAKARRYFDTDWLAQAYPELGEAAEIEEAFHKLPELWQRQTSQNFDPKAVPVLSQPDGQTKAGRPGGLSEFLRLHFRAERQAYDQLHAALQENDLERARLHLTRIEARYGSTIALVGARAYLAVMDHDWSTAHSAMNTLWLTHQRDSRTVRHRPSLLNDYDTTNAHAFERVCHGKTAPADLGKVCIYTTIFGDSDALLPNLNPSENLRFICFSDVPRQAPGWEVRVVKRKFTSLNMSAKYYKVLAHKVLPEFEYSLFIDGNTLLAGDIERLVFNYLADNPFVMWPHPERSDIYREAVAILQSGRHRSKEISQQIQAYAEQGLPPKTGLAEGSFLWRKHGDEDTRAFMQDWWEEIMLRSARDQLSLGYLFWRRQQKPKVLPPHLGTSRRNTFFLKLPHRNPQARMLPSRRAPITFLFHPERRESGSTVMRGEQLSGMLGEALQDREVLYSQGLVWHGRILFLTKGFLEKTSVADLQRLQDQGNFLIGDFVDGKPDPKKAACVDILVAASIAAYEYCSQTFLQTPVYHLTHHVDPRIAPGNDAEGFEAGYIGEEVNAIWTPEIKERVALIQVNTKNRDDSWLQHIRSSNFHYAVRHTRDIDGFKPFLKGFTAARCEAPILTQKTIGDAVYYLGEDYPFFLPANPTEEEITSLLDQAKSSYGTPLWQQAKDRMRQLAERSSDKMVISEFTQILKH